MDNTAKALLLLTIVAARSSTVAGDCSVREITQENPCGGELLCARDFSDAISNIVQMPCMYIYGDYSEEHILHQDFNVTVKATDFEFDANDSSVISEIKDHVIAISITNGQITKFPDVILYMGRAMEVDLSVNKIESLNLTEFSRLGMLNVLNVSYNNIAHLDAVVLSADTRFASVNTIDLSHNKIQGILQNAIPPYPSLQHLNLSFNYIESFGENELNNLTRLVTLDISNNIIIQLGTSLNGLVNVEHLLLDHNKLTNINKVNFYRMSALKDLNISSNSLKSIESTSFCSLYTLKELDMSNNQIKVLEKSTFQNNTLLRSLDVSFNNISKIESGAFTGAHIEYLKLHNNTLDGYLDTDAFNGLYFENLDLSDADISGLGPDLFGPHPSFQSLNFSKNAISKISKTTFRNLHFLIELDLSYNKLQGIDFDTADLSNLTYFYINNNAIKDIRKATFEPLYALYIIDLSSNNIEYIEMLAFKHLNNLTYLILKDNPLTAGVGQHTFDGLISCYSLDLSGTAITKLQNNSFNGMTSMNKLNLSNSDIRLLEFNVFNGTESIVLLDLSHNHVEAFSINQTNFKMQELLLGWNDITSITKISFQGLRKVISIDISHNRLSNIQPGSFRDCKILQNLYLFNNCLSFLQFGAFDGLKDVLTIDLSNNMFHRFDGKLFYNTYIATVYLDNNFIDKINFSDFSLANILTLSIGGNLISCESLTSLEERYNSPLRLRDMPLSLVAKKLNFDTENVNGIACKSQSPIHDTENAVKGNIYLDKIINLSKDTNRYLAANLGVQGCAVLIALCIYVYFKFRSKLTLSRIVSSSREALSNAIELE